VTALNYGTHPSEDVTFAMAFPVVAWALGEAARNRRVAIAEATRRAVGDEQARIARELHDVIAHSVSVIVVQAAAADDVFDERPDRARAALRAIESAGREALGDLRRLLAGVRTGEPGEGGRPQPGLGRLDELAQPLRSAGLEVVLRDEGVVASIPAGVDLSAYRIVQEALTNSLKHAGPTRASVVVHYDRDAVVLDISDDGRVPTLADGSGHGLTGMREWVSLYGGELHAGPSPDGGFAVSARLPVEPATS
jgi:signal transduction histidine kinase